LVSGDLHFRRRELPRPSALPLGAQAFGYRNVANGQETVFPRCLHRTFHRSPVFARIRRSFSGMPTARRHVGAKGFTF